MKTVIAGIRKSVIPAKTVERSKTRIAEMALGLVNEAIAEYPEIVGAEFGGSFAKGTWLPKDADVDIFVRFKKSTPEEQFEKIARKVGFGALGEFSPYVRYSEHPYVEARVRGTTINVVPFYDIKAGEWKSSADRSPFHTEYMSRALTRKMRNEVRVLKAFLKSNGIYGAEIAKQGFSGYVSEVLVLHFGSFENVIMAVSKIRENETVGKAGKKFDTSLVIIDPVDENRNLAAAISDESIGKFILVCRAFKKKPGGGFFKHKRPRVSKKHWKNVLSVRFGIKPRSPDIVWGQIKRATATLNTQLEQAGFTVLRSRAYTDQRKEAGLLFFLESTKISEIYAKSGPDFFREDSSENFISKNLSNAGMMWVGNDKKIVSLEKRKYTDADRFVTNFLKNNLLTGMPKGLQDDLRRGFKVTTGEKGLGKSIKEAASELISTDGTLLRFS